MHDRSRWRLIFSSSCSETFLLGTLNKGDFIFNTKDQKKTKVARLVRMHSDKMEDVSSVQAGEICALFGLECGSGDTFVANSGHSLTMESMLVSVGGDV